MTRTIMTTLIQIKTPKGLATRTAQQLKPFIIGAFYNKHKTWTSPEDDVIYWEVEDELKKIMNINANLSRFDTLIKGIFENKQIQKLTGQQISKEQITELKEMLANQTSIEIIKKQTREETTTEGTTWWQTIKQKFKKT
jgi:DNA primase